LPHCLGITRSNAQSAVPWTPAERRLKVLRPWLLAFGLCAALAGAARADTAAAPPQIPDAVKDSAALDQDQIQTVDDSVAAVAKSIADGSDPTAQSADRHWLLDALADSGGNQGTNDYLTHFTHLFAVRMLAMISAPNANFRAKIEVGLAAQEIARRANSTELCGLAVKLLQDQSSAVALVGMKVAANVLPSVVAKSTLDPSDEQFLEAMVAAVASHPDPPLGGSIAEEAYQAFLSPVLNPVGDLPPWIQTSMVPLVIKLEQSRIAEYQNGVPENPPADSTGVVFLLCRNVWISLTPAQQHDSIQVAADLIASTAKWAVLAKNGNGQIDGAPLVEALQRDGRELRNFSDTGGGVSPNQQLNDAVVRMANLGSGSGATAIQESSDTAVEALKSFSTAAP
jgi:hypothetical protein